ncbi:MAG: D-inositol-3-phosphate glycosyltransferase [Phycisphaerae bacterium]|nr:D-inositol-3-phosphate glycosyltransferase [Phycisphaerae bacterium]
MKVFMLGWEFPPYISGGLGTACFGLTRALDAAGVSVLFVLPRAVDNPRAEHVKLLTAASIPRGTLLREEVSEFRLKEFGHAEFVTVDASIAPYDRPAEPPKTSRTATPTEKEVLYAGRKVSLEDLLATPSASGPAPTAVVPMNDGPGANYAGDLFREIERYAQLAALIARDTEFDVIHAHDWMTFPAAITVRGLSGKPLVVHVHSTEFDRSGEHVNQRIYDFERAGMHIADRVIAVSHLTRNIVVNRYSVDPKKVSVVYNGIDDDGGMKDVRLPAIARDEKIVLFLGRVTMQKGPEYFLAAAKRVLEHVQNVRFIMAGSGDMIRRTIEMAAQMGIGHKVLFTGFLRGDDVKRIYRMADLYVMPSVSEPFGIAPLEALSNDVPVLISKQSGVAEVLTHALKVDFWDIDEMANKIIAVLRHPPLQNTLRDHGRIEVGRLTWSEAAERCEEVYRQMVASPRR